MHAGREHLLADPVFDVGDVVAVRLGHGALGGGVGIGRRHLERDAEVGLALVGDGVEVRHAGAELAQRDRWFCAQMVGKPVMAPEPAASADARPRRS